MMSPFLCLVGSQAITRELTLFMHLAVSRSRTHSCRRLAPVLYSGANARSG